MSISIGDLPTAPALVRLSDGDSIRWALWRRGVLRDLSVAQEEALHSLDRILSLPLSQARSLLDGSHIDELPPLNPEWFDLRAPVEVQEVWAAGVTYEQSREARMEEAESKDIYARVYEAERPELFFKAAGWRVVPPDGQVGVRPDSTWDVPEPELAVLSNSSAEVFAYSCGNDMSSRSIEGENPLYLPQAKVYDASCSIGPVAVLAWHLDPSRATIAMRIEREGREVFAGTASVESLVREPADLAGVLHAAYPLPVGAWLLTGTSLVPPQPYTALPGDSITIAIDGLGTLRNMVIRVPHSGARAPVRPVDTTGVERR